MTRNCSIDYNNVTTTPFKKEETTKDNNNTNKLIIVTVPARVDLSGGWSDTRPISYEFGGSAANLSVTIDKNPFLIKCHRTSNCGSGNNGGIMLIIQDLVSKKVVHVNTVWDLIKDYRNTLHGEAVLLKSVLICLGLIPL